MSKSTFPLGFPKSKQVVKVTVKKDEGIESVYVSEGIVMRRNAIPPDSFYIYLNETDTDCLRHIYWSNTTKRWTAEYCGKEVEVTVKVIG